MTIKLSQKEINKLLEECIIFDPLNKKYYYDLLNQAQTQTQINQLKENINIKKGELLEKALEINIINDEVKDNYLKNLNSLTIDKFKYLNRLIFIHNYFLNLTKDDEQKFINLAKKLKIIKNTFNFNRNILNNINNDISKYFELLINILTKKDFNDYTDDDKENLINIAELNGITFNGNKKTITISQINKLINKLIIFDNYSKKSEESKKLEESKKSEDSKESKEKCYRSLLRRFAKNTYLEMINIKYAINNYDLFLRDNEKNNEQLFINLSKLLEYQIEKLYYDSYFNIDNYINIINIYYTNFIDKNIFDDYIQYLSNTNKYSYYENISSLTKSELANLPKTFIYINSFGKFTILNDINNKTDLENKVNAYNANVKSDIKDTNIQKFNIIDIDNIINKSYFIKFNNIILCIFIDPLYFGDKKEDRLYKYIYSYKIGISGIFTDILDKTYYLMFIFYIIALNAKKYQDIYNYNYLYTNEKDDIKEMIGGKSKNKQYQLYINDKNKYYIIYNKKNIYLNKKNTYKKNNNHLYLKINKNIEVNIKYL